MNSDELRFHKMLQVMADQCSFPLSETTIEIYDKCLAPYGYARVCGAIYEIFKTRRGGDKFPSVADIKAKLGVMPVSDRSMAVECTNLIIWAFTHWRDQFTAREDFDELYKKIIGEYPHSVVIRMGGYRAIYREWMECGDRAVMRAQIRDAALAVLELTRADNMVEHLGVNGTDHKRIGDGKE